MKKTDLCFILLSFLCFYSSEVPEKQGMSSGQQEKSGQGNNDCRLLQVFTELCSKQDQIEYDKGGKDNACDAVSGSEGQVYPAQVIFLHNEMLIY